MNNKLAERSELMDGYDVERDVVVTDVLPIHKAPNNITYRVYRYEKPNVGKPIKVYKLLYYNLYTKFLISVQKY